jgi:L-amino acid N-acyltransferase YncA
VRPSAAMNGDDMRIRDARETDARSVAAIYAHHVINGTASYDTEPPSEDSIRLKIRNVVAAGWPFLVAERDGSIVGYAYATRFRDRAAYGWTAENSIYVHPEWMGQGVGKILLRELCGRAEACGFRQMIAVIGGAEDASVRLHAACGFNEVGRLHAAGWKKGRWLDNVYMQLALGPGSSGPPRSKPAGSG